MSQQRLTDNMLQEWGTRLFYGMPAKGKKTKGGTLIGAAVGAASQASQTSGASQVSAASVRNLVRSAVRPKAQQVMVKITGGGRGMKAVAAHFRYIGRQGKPEVGGKGQSLQLEDENGNKLTGAKAIEDLQYDWRMAGSYLPDESPRREVFNIMLSMPAGTPPQHVRDAARAFAKETFEGHKYVFVLHEDTNSPHVHLAVRGERNDGHRLNPRKADLQRWRERFAARLQDRGVSAVATRASTRGVTTAPRRIWQARVGSDGRGRSSEGRVDMPRVRSLESVQQSKRNALEAWEHIAKALVSSPDKPDQALALEVVRYVSSEFSIPMPGRAVDRAPTRTSTQAPTRPPTRGGDEPSR